MVVLDYQAAALVSSALFALGAALGLRGSDPRWVLQTVLQRGGRDRRGHPTSAGTRRPDDQAPIVILHVFTCMIERLSDNMTIKSRRPAPVGFSFVHNPALTPDLEIYRCPGDNCMDCEDVS